MKKRHFDAIRPVCAVCRTAGIESPLEVGRADREEGGDLLEGVLRCAQPGCQREYPVIDGIPLLVPALRAYVSQHIGAILRRDDLSGLTESLLGDCCGPGSTFDQSRQHLSTYAWGHYHDLDPAEPEGPAPSLLGLLARGVELAGAPGAGPILDAGCSVGRATFELAGRFERLVLGVDLSFSMLQIAARALRTGVVKYPRRRVGVVFDERSFPARFARPDLVDFWVCDAQDPPFAAGTFSAVTSLNLLDCLPSPHDHLLSVARVLAPGGRAVFSTPYDWSPAATPIEAWIGGHSQRGPQNGESAVTLRALLTPGAHPASVEQLALVAEDDAIPWRVRLHDRSTVEYGTHLLVAEKR